MLGIIDIGAALIWGRFPKSTSSQTEADEWCATTATRIVKSYAF
jgi:hypothetical protein